MLELGFTRAEFHSYPMPRGFVLWVLGDRRLRVSIQEIIFVYSSHTPHPTPHFSDT
uniref:Uncharacterized protein n=2 Tax=Microcystis aeruginosa (strain PCC 7806) TaxID=267872 RepID=A8YG09_MICA7|nr:unnamed protein product [Microcystis aeruginosa PCC 7806]